MPKQNLNVDLQVGDDVSHVVAQVPEGQVACLLGQVSGPPCLATHDPPGPLQVHLDALQPQQILEHHIVLGQDLHSALYTQFQQVLEHHVVLGQALQSEWMLSVKCCNTHSRSRGRAAAAAITGTRCTGPKSAVSTVLICRVLTMHTADATCSFL